MSYRKYTLTKIRKQNTHLCSLAVSTQLSHPAPIVPVHLLELTGSTPPSTALGPAVHWRCHLDSGTPPLVFFPPPKLKAMVAYCKSALASPLPLCFVGRTLMLVSATLRRLVWL